MPNVLGLLGVGMNGEPPAMHHRRTLQVAHSTATTNAPLPCCTPTGSKCCGVRGSEAGRASQSQPKGSHSCRGLADAERLRKDDAQLLEFLAVAVDLATGEKCEVDDWLSEPGRNRSGA